MCKVQDFSATQILREINFGDFEAHKHCHCNYMSKSEFLDIFDIFKCEIPKN